MNDDSVMVTMNGDNNKDDDVFNDEENNDYDYDGEQSLM